MRINIDGDQRIDLKGLFGKKEVSIEAIQGDFHISEIVLYQGDAVSFCRTAEDSITDFEVQAGASESKAVLKMLNAEADKIRFGEHIEIRDTDDIVIGYCRGVIKAAAVAPDDATHTLVTIYFNSTSKNAPEGLYLERELTTGDYLYLFEDTNLLEGEKTAVIDTNINQVVYLNGTGVIEVSKVKKKA